ncbi:unnamed protein product [Rotaria sordida]|uniref:PDZ domain-containing protein n=1 Tax=Rotaria sordida TaxID=392033 RepID=A0A815XCK8_9BILA|nr:unnamed protein product [Rotaria sordida]
MTTAVHDQVQKNRQNASELNSLTHITQLNYDDHWEEIEIHLKRGKIPAKQKNKIIKFLILFKSSGPYLGFSIGGGSDIFRINGSRAIVVTRITAGGLTDRDQQLKLHDIILRVNNINFTNIKHRTAVDILRAADNHVNLLIRRLLPPIQEKIYIKIPPGTNLGLLIVGGIDHEYIEGDPGIFIINIIPGTVAHANGRLKVGDRLMYIQSSKNTFDLTYVWNEQAVELIRRACNESETITLLVGHPTYLDGARNVQMEPTTRRKIKSSVKRTEAITETVKDNPVKRRIVADINNGSGNAKNNKGDDYDDDLGRSRIRHKCEDTIVTDLRGKFDNVIGLKQAKEALKEAIILPVIFPHFFQNKRTPWTSILLYGPTGTGKSYLAKAIDAECKSPFISVSSLDLFSEWPDKSERNVKALFEHARERQPYIVFIDHIDALCGKRNDTESESSRRIKKEFLAQMQSIRKDNPSVLVLAATNIPWALDTTILRSYSGADINVVCREALLRPIRRLRSATHFKKIRNPKAYGPRHLWLVCSPEDLAAEEITLDKIKSEDLCEPPVTMKDMIAALATQKPTVGKYEILTYERFTQQINQQGS